jgi:hypothetical protein
MPQEMIRTNQERLEEKMKEIMETLFGSLVPNWMPHEKRCRVTEKRERLRI